MNDIVTILRDISNESGLDADLAEACRDGASEISRLRLTDAEREAVTYFTQWGRWDAGKPHAATLRGLLERTK